MKRGMEAIQLVVALVIALVIAIIVIGMISGKLGGFSKATSCTGSGGNCVARTQACAETDLVAITTTDCQGSNHCCLPR